MFSFKLVDVSASVVDDSVTLYLELLKKRVVHILAEDAPPLTEQRAHMLCEYVDSVAGGLLPMQEALYKEITSLIAGYLLHCDELSRKRLCGKNWTANTLMEVLRSKNYKHLPGEVYPTELVA